MSLDNFIRLADSLVEFEADLNDNQFPVTSNHALEIHRSELRSNWNRIKAAYEKFLFEVEKETDDNEEPADLESIKLKYKSTYITYCNCLVKLSEFMTSSSQSRVSPSPSSHSTPNSHSLHLPPIEIEAFHGDYASWPTFRDMFTAIVFNSKASNVEKLFYLNQKTKGEAREIVQKSPLTNEGFDLAWRDLCARYENRRVLVNGQLKILFNLQTIHAESGNALKQLQRDIDSCISLLKLYNIDISSWDPIFVFICANKLPENTLTLWEQELKDKAAIPKWSELSKFISNRYRTLESVSEMRSSNNSKANDTRPRNNPNSNAKQKVHSFQAKVSSPQCQLCPKESHAIRKCPKFLKMDHQQRFSEIKKEGLCINCFSKTHTLKNCSSKTNCFKCQKRHNTLLHRDIDNSNTNTNYNAYANTGPSSSTNSQLNPNSAPFSRTNLGTIQSTTNPSSSRVQSCFSSHSAGVLLGTALINIYHLGLEYQARALIDTGSEGTFISDRLFNLLKLPSQPTNAKISGLNNTVSANVQQQCSMVLGSRLNKDISVTVTALVVPHLANSLPSQPIPKANFENLPSIPLADPNFFHSSKIDILLGGDVFPAIVRTGIQHNVCDSLVAQETIFGWILTGPVFRHPKSNISVASHFCEISLDKEFSHFWEVENLPRKNFMSTSDQFCEDLYLRTTTRNSEGRYIVSLPFKEGFPNLVNVGHSRSSAMAQFFRNESRLIKTPNFKIEYDNVVQEYEQLGHMFQIESSNLNNSPHGYYLPHHAVIKPDSSTTKVRVVFNASAPSSNGQSLNSLLHVGPILQTDLTLLILKWRFFQFVFNADIQKMYRQILINPEHTPYQRILFRKDPSSTICDYELKTVTFGVNCAPYLAIRTLLQLADDVQPTYPVASSILRNSMYVDDVLAGAHTKLDSVKAKSELEKALESAGFLLRKWTSNSMDILNDIPPEHLLHEDFLKFEDSSSAKTLGIRWNACADEFFFASSQIQESTNYTKREVLSQIARLFDPAGWLAPCIVQAKILMQKIWIDGTGWDEVISTDALQQWKSFQSNYPYINSIRIPRWIGFSPNFEVQFHGFCDASEKAYAAALYVRISDDNSTYTHLITSKTKVAPIKTLSIPRLELCGALLLAEMIDSILPQLDIEKYSLFCWTDSTIVLSWLAKPPCVWLTFVANRVSKITQITNFSQWHHVESETNPADVASRGLCPQDLADCDLWWFGPRWLKSIPSEWPNIPKIPPTELEVKPIHVHFSYFSNFEDILERFSSFSKAIRIISYVYRFFFHTHPRFRHSFCKESTLLSSSELNCARDQLISVCQKANFPNEYKALSTGNAVQKSSDILNLNPFLDAEGIIRSCGRLESSLGLTYNERYPIILPYNCQYSRLLIKFIHEISLHGGNQLVLRLLRNQYWIPRVKNLIKTTINKCKPCVIYKKRCQRQLMAALPPERTELTRPFAHTGLDFAGPLDIKSFSGRACRISKGYVCVFVCFATKAIHLEATNDLSTSAFLAAFTRFVSRRGCPLHLHSDNGTTFVGASRILSKEFLKSSHELITSSYSHQNITWHFIPAGAPHMGGLWEAGVKSFKAHFRKVTGGIKYTYEELSTLLSKIEACLNSRPISPMSLDPSDLAALTPGHFLIGSPIIVPIDPEVNDLSISTANRWQRLKILNHNFCMRWKNEYLKELHKRNKWQRPEENLSEGALVVVKDENLPPNSWRLGRVSKIYEGSDNRVRVADVITQRGQITRPIVKLVLLPSET